MRLEFDHVVVDTDRRILIVRGERVHLPPRLFATLQVLVEHHDRVLSRDDLKRAVWPETHVADNSVTQAVKAVRRVLAATGARDRVRTVPRRGYCFCGPVVTSPEDRAAEPAVSRAVQLWGDAAPRLPMRSAALMMAFVIALTILAVGQYQRLRPERSATLYLEGQSFLATRRAADLRKAVKRFSEAVDSDRDHYDALTALAQSRYLLVFYGIAERDAIDAALDAADEAIRVDPARPAAHAVRGSIALDSRWDLTESGRDFARALRLDPNHTLTRHWAAWWCLAADRLTDARTMIDSAVRREPFSPMLLTARATFAYLDEDFAAAERDARRALALDPDFFRAHLRLGLVDLLSGRHEAAIERLEHARMLAPDVPETTAAVAHAYAVAGQHGRAWRVAGGSHGLTEYDRAIVLTGLQMYPEALDALLAARHHGRLVPGLFAHEPRLAPLRGQPRFHALVSSLRRARSAAPALALADLQTTFW